MFDIKTVADVKAVYGSTSGPLPFALGTRVRATEGEKWCFPAGAEGEVVHVDADGDVWVDFGKHSLDEERTLWVVTWDHGPHKGQHFVEAITE